MQRVPYEGPAEFVLDSMCLVEETWKGGMIRDRFQDEFNCSNMDDLGPMGGDLLMKVLKNMHDLEVGHELFLKSLAS